MANGHLSYREVIPNQSVVRRCFWTIRVNTGAAQSTLQDIKLPECAGGYTYKESNRYGSVTRNRFIYWKVSHDVLELIEQSLDYNLHGNQVRFRFQDSPVLDGVTIHETANNVVVLVATVFSVHRLIFIHPNKLQHQDYLGSHSLDHTWPSIFADASSATVQDPAASYVINWVNGTTAIPRSASSWLTNDENAVFAIASNLDRITVICMPRPDSQGTTSIQELRHSSIMQRLWTGIVPAAIRGGPEPGDSPLSICVHPIDNILYVFALCRDCKLRMWSCHDCECVMMADVIELTNELPLASHRKLQGPQPHVLRKALGSTSSCLYLGLFLCFANHKVFCVTQPVQVLGRFQLALVVTVQAPDYHLIDFSLTLTDIWALWSTSNSEVLLNVISIDSEDSPNPNWVPVCLQSPPDREFHFVDGIADPREAFMQDIFRPGNFSVQTITKAISIFRRAAEASFISEVNVPLAVMQEEVSTVVEKEIQMQASEYEMSDDEYLQLQLECWSKFYSCCVQYQEVEAKVMGLVVDPNTGLVCFVKKSQFSVLRPQDPIEEWVLSGDPSDMCLSAITDDKSVWGDLVNLMKCLSVIDSNLSDDVKYAFQHDLLHRQNPEDIIQAVMDTLLAPEGDGISFLPELAKTSIKVNSLVGAVEMVLATIDLAHGQPEALAFDDEMMEISRNDAGHWLFASDIGSSIVAKSVAQMAQVRYDLCRNLLFYLHLVQHLGEKAKITEQMTEKIESELISQTATLLRTYFVLIWASNTVATQVPRNTLESGLCQLALLNISDPPIKTPSTSSKAEKPFAQQRSLVEMFVRSDGGNQARALLAQNHFLDNELSSKWSRILTPLVQTVGQLLWPISIHFAFPEFLLVHCQYLQLSEYARLLDDWCDWNSASRRFLLGHVCLNLSEHDKAVDWFLKASEGVAEEFLTTKILQAPADNNGSELSTTYFVKVIDILQQFGLPDQALTIAKSALKSAKITDPHVTTLWSVTFQCHLNLGHNEEAYAAIGSNPDASQKKDCLRQFVVVLCERRQFQKLVDFPYDGLHDEFVAILESRARSVDLTMHNYYDVLYSFHVIHGNFRKAGSVMYEFGMRLGNEVSGLKGLQRQAKCYLTTLNCIRLVDPNYAWIVKPIICPMTERTCISPGASPKRSFDGEELPPPSRRQLEVLELDAIKKEYDILHARLHLFRKEPELANGTNLLSAPEIIGLLINVGLFDIAIHLCHIFQLPLHSVFEGLTSRCVQLSRNSKVHSDMELNKAWDWLSENDLSSVKVGPKSSAADHAWALLKSYLTRLEDDGQSRYHRCIAMKLLLLGAPLPLWLIRSYKKLNVAELMSLYVDFDILEEATQIALEYIDGVMGIGKESFGLESALHANCQPVWMPYTVLDRLLDALGSVSKDPAYNLLLNDLNSKLNDYQNLLATISRDMVLLKQKRGS